MATCSYLLSRNLLFCYGGCMFILTKLGLLSDRFATIFCIDILISQKKKLYVNKPLAKITLPPTRWSLKREKKSFNATVFRLHKKSDSTVSSRLGKSSFEYQTNFLTVLMFR